MEITTAMKETDFYSIHHIKNEAVVTGKELTDFVEEETSCYSSADGETFCV